MLPVVTVSGLTKRYGAFTALDGVGFSMRRGEVLGLVGPNGAGKTTLLECLAGLRPFDAGAIEIDGQMVPPGTPDGRLFYLPDGIAPWRAERVSWVLDYVVGFFGGSAAAKHALVHELGLAPLLAARVGTLSKGQRKRVLLALGLIVPHPVLLCDEPFDGLDLRQTREVGAVLRKEARRGRTLFLSIHQISDAARVCDRFVLLSGGRTAGEGTLEELATRLPAGAGAPSLEEVVLGLT